jgi:hypothetical protein
MRMRVTLLLSALALALAAGLGVAPVAAAGTVQLGQVGGSHPHSCVVDNYNFQTAVASGNSYTVPAGAWTLTSWSTAGPATAVSPAAQAAFIVARPNSAGDAYTYVYVGPTETLVPGVVNTFPVSFDVEPGDLIGFWGSANATCVNVTFDDGDLSLGDDAPGSVGKPVQGSTEADAALYHASDAQLNVSATLVPRQSSARVMVCTAAPRARANGSVGRFFDLDVGTWAAGAADSSSYLYGAEPAIYVEGLGTMCQLSDVVTYGGTPDAYEDSGFMVNQSGIPTPEHVSPSDWGAVYEYYGKK